MYLDEFNIRMTLDSSLVAGLFHRFMCRVARCKKVSAGQSVDLYYRQIFMPVDDDHQAFMEMLPAPESKVKVDIQPLDKLLHGRMQGIQMGGGGGAKIICAHSVRYERESSNPLLQGSRAGIQIRT